MLIQEGFVQGVILGKHIMRFPRPSGFENREIFWVVRINVVVQEG